MTYHIHFNNVAGYKGPQHTPKITGTASFKQCRFNKWWIQIKSANHYNSSTNQIPDTFFPDIMTEITLKIGCLCNVNEMTT